MLDKLKPYPLILYRKHRRVKAMLLIMHTSTNSILNVPQFLND